MKENRFQSALWSKLEGFQFGTGEEQLSFEKRLARENGWTVGFARRVVDEYKRFVYLCSVAGHPCTPSDQVDQAWHLHLTYTKSYWEDMCRELLPQPLHHNPTKGGVKEDSKFDDWYSATKRSYLHHFGVEPPADIWPAADQRFGEDPIAQRVNLRRNWVIPKDPVARFCRFSVPSVLILTLAGCAASEQFGVALAVTIGGLILVGVIASAVIAGATNGKKKDGSAGCGGSSGCGHGDVSHGHSSGDSGCGSSGCASSGCGSGCGGGGCGGGCGS